MLPATVTLTGGAGTLSGVLPTWNGSARDWYGGGVGIIAPILLIALRLLQGLGASAVVASNGGPDAAEAGLGAWLPIAGTLALLTAITVVAMFFTRETIGHDLDHSLGRLSVACPLPLLSAEPGRTAAGSIRA